MGTLYEKLLKENAQLKDEIRRLETYRAMAYRDDLTGIYNRRHFHERLREELARARRCQWPCSLVTVDVDDFKRFNDEMGHATGDRVLVAVARFLETHLREIDICCRVGGDEFSVILPCTGSSGVETIVARLKEGPLAPVVRGAPKIHLSMGSATFPKDADGASALIALADQRMYAHKRGDAASSPKDTEERAPPARAAS